MEWMQVLIIIGSLLGGVFYIHSDVKQIRQEIHKQGVRTDRLYGMFIDLLREDKKCC